MLGLAACGTSSDDSWGSGSVHYSIYGLVTDSATSTPLVGAEVALTPGNLTARTDSDGFYTFSVSKTGNYTVQASADGYAGQSQNVTVQAGSTGSGCNIALVPNGGIAPPEVTPEPDYSGARIDTTLPHLEVKLVSCERSDTQVLLTCTLQNNYDKAEMNVSVTNVNPVTEKTSIADNLDNEYAASAIKITLGGKTLGYGNSIDGDLSYGEPVTCTVTVDNVAEGAAYMTYRLWCSNSFPGSVVTSDYITVENVKIH